VNGVRGIFQLPKFSVVVWVRKTDEFEAIRNDLISLVGDEPFETTEYEGMVDFHWGAEEHAKAKQIADSLREISKRSEIVLLRVSSLDDAIASFSCSGRSKIRPRGGGNLGHCGGQWLRPWQGGNCEERNPYGHSGDPQDQPLRPLIRGGRVA
jgi:hypothetical protein